MIPFKTREVSAAEEDSREALSEALIPAVIKVVATGGGGGNAINRMIESGLKGVEFIAINTDIQDLHNKSKAEKKIQIGLNVTGGRGAGGKPEKGEQAALEDSETIAKVLKGADMVVIAAGMGGGTGTGSAHVIAKIAREHGALTVAVVTTPFEYEGRYKMQLAEDGIEKLRKEVDSIIIIPNQNLFKLVDKNTSMDKSYEMADSILCKGVNGIAELITKVGKQNIDFADVETVMKGQGTALLCIGSGTGENRAAEAVKSATDNPLLEDTSIEGATKILINISAPKNITLIEQCNIINAIREKSDPNVHIITGIYDDLPLEDTIQITVIATGFENGIQKEAKISDGKKVNNTDVISHEVFKKMQERTKRPDYSGGVLPPKDYKDDLDIPSFFRNQNLYIDKEPGIDKAENS